MLNVMAVPLLGATVVCYRWVPRCRCWMPFVGAMCHSCWVQWWDANAGCHAGAIAGASVRCRWMPLLECHCWARWLGAGAMVRCYCWGCPGCWMPLNLWKNFNLAKFFCEWDCGGWNFKLTWSISLIWKLASVTSLWSRASLPGKSQSCHLPF